MNSRVRSLFVVIFILFLCFNDTGCAPKRLQTVDMAIERSGAGRVNIETELAKTQDEHSRGLMYRKRLDDGQGMLFIFDRDEILSFWMKNTLIPLSIAFISSDGRIMEIRDMQPQDLNLIRSSRSVRYALEVPQGWFGRVNVQVGDKLILEAIR